MDRTIGVLDACLDRSIGVLDGFHCVNGWSRCVAGWMVPLHEWMVDGLCVNE